MVNIEIQNREYLKMVKVTLENDSVRVESGAMYYTVGTLEMEAKAPSLGGFLKAALTKEKAVRPVYRGTGQLFLEPTFGEFSVLELNGEEWILDKGAYYASELGIDVDMWTNKSITGLFGGEGFFQTKVSGRGKVVIKSGGPLEVIDLNNDKLVVDGSFAVARTGNLEFRVEKATKGLFATALSGEGLVNTFTGTGRVLLAPVPNRYLQLMNQFDSIQHGLSDIRSAVSSHSD